MIYDPSDVNKIVAAIDRNTEQLKKIDESLDAIVFWFFAVVFIAILILGGIIHLPPVVIAH